MPNWHFMHIGAGLCAVTEMTIAPEVILGMVRWKWIFVLMLSFWYFFPFFPNKNSLPSLSMPIVYKDLNFFVQHFPKFVYLCPHQPKKNIPTQKITDYITYWYKAFLLFKYCWNLDNFNLTTQESGTLTVYPWAFLFVVKVVQNRSNRQKFTDSFCDPSEGRSAQNAKP